MLVLLVRVNPDVIEGILSLPLRGVRLAPRAASSVHATDCVNVDRTQLREAFAAWKRRGGTAITLERVRETYADRDGKTGARCSRHYTGKRLEIERVALVFSWPSGRIRLWGRRSRRTLEWREAASAQAVRDMDYDRVWAHLQGTGTVQIIPLDALPGEAP